jgi:hypothetical protein
VADPDKMEKQKLVGARTAWRAQHSGQNARAGQNHVERQVEIPFKGGSLSHPEIPISECEPFSTIISNFLKDFKLK